MFLHAYKHARLMKESETRVEMSPYMQSPADALATSMLARPEIRKSWLLEHDRLMRQVSKHTRVDGQVTALRSTALGLVHRRAFFEYLRERRLNRRKRHKLFSLFFGCRDYANAVVSAHGDYLRCSSSYVCTNHLGEHLMEDAAFDEPLQLYEEWYRDYFRTHCDVELADTDEEREDMKAFDALRPLLKYRLVDARRAILAMPHQIDKDWREVQIRKPNGDTQRMRVFFGED
jgi:hypothetical protein